MKIGLVGKDNNKGLGTLTMEYMRHLPIDELVCVGKKHENRYKATYVNDISSDLDRVLSVVDCLFILETYDATLIKKAKEKGVKTILKVNYEFLREELPVLPDLFICSTTKNYKAVKYDNKILLPDPVNTDLIKFKQRYEAKTFLHNAGTLGVGAANCTYLLLDAIPLVESDVKFIIQSQVKLPKIDDPRVEVRVQNVPNYWNLWGEGDVFIMLQKFRATSLPIQEAMANGMPVLSSDIEPFNQFCEFLVKPFSHTMKWAERPLDYHHFRETTLANKIDEIAGQDITQASKNARIYAESISWKKLKNKYIEVCHMLLSDSDKLVEQFTL